MSAIAANKGGRILTLLRHAKALPDETAANDSERGLALRGESDAIAVGKALFEHGIRPDLVLCSTSKRTRQTLDGIRPDMPAKTKIAFEQRLYLATEDMLLAIVQGVPDDATSVLIIGHNPGIHELAVSLTHAADDAKDLAALTARFPTSGCAVFTFAAEHWRGLQRNSGQLVYHTSPARLA